MRKRNNHACRYNITNWTMRKRKNPVQMNNALCSHHKTALKESPVFFSPLFWWWLLIVFVSLVNFIMRDLLCLNISDAYLFHFFFSQLILLCHFISFHFFSLLDCSHPHSLGFVSCAAFEFQYHMRMMDDWCKVMSNGNIKENSKCFLLIFDLSLLQNGQTCTQ